MTETEAKKTSEAARDEILSSIRCNLAASVPFDAVRRLHRDQDHARSAVASFAASPSRKDLLETFCENLKTVGGYCAVVTGEEAAAKAVDEILEQTSSLRIAVSNSALIRRLIYSGQSREIFENAAADVLFSCDIGVTSAQWAIAETGTLVLESERESHRLTSLIPPVHLCILKASSIKNTMAEILELTARELSRTITFITGASRTSDIELTLAIGVHGPKELHVIVIGDQ